ncbi:MAG: cytochrome C [Candidatus Zixiibacteriota bacterium]|nr:MAG: cytochrome C [candidate division Zixibacteria bacterium]
MSNKEPARDEIRGCIMNFRQILILVVVSFILMTINIYAQQGGCVTDKCHADTGTKKFIHGPVGAGICQICHVPVEGEDHKFQFMAEKEELCFNCHENKRDMMLEEYLHTPVADGNCIGCHDPHQSDFRYTLKGNAADLCYGCHTKDAFNKQFIHGPIGVGDCNACHNPHASPNVKQLNSPPEELCFQCHREQAELLNKRHIHTPVKEKCVNCHDPHSNVSKFLLPSMPPGLCYECHEQIATHAGATNPHDPVAQGQCDKCHDVHASENPNMFVLSPTELCFSCHSELRDYVDAQQYKHGPVKQGDCNACHNPHGSENHKILKKYFPEEFYASYAEENYAMCFECHNSQVAKDPRTTTLTDFRNKDINLHYLHVNKEIKGRSCRSCHQAHASSQEKHVRTSVPYGKISWDLPVTFTKNENGGSCVVGCHAPKEYSRK